MKKKSLPQYDEYEKDLMNSIEKGEWRDVANFQLEKAKLAAVAERTLNKSKRINIRLTDRDYELANIRAIEEGIPYQTLLASIIHKYLTGILQDTRR